MAKKNKKQKWSPIQAAKAAARLAHFANGGTLAQWRGSARTFTDRRKQKNKTACRGRVQL
jgi:hypothetical protein